MLATLRFGHDAYGTRIWQEIWTGKSAIVGTLHPVPARLERKGYVSSWIGEPTPKRGGRAKRYFQIEHAGKVALKESRKMLASMFAGLDPILGSF
jgi:DNA-binding PadR family transcriptional regulator